MAYNDRGTIRARVIEYLDGRTDLDEKINAWINDTRRDIAIPTPYHRFAHLYVEATLDTVPGVARYPLPTDYLDHLDIFIGNKKLVRIAPREFDSIVGSAIDTSESSYGSQYLQTSIGSDQGEPDYYIDRGLTFDLWPVPSKAYTLLLRYYAMPEEFTQDSDSDYITTFFTEAVIMGAAYRGAVYLEDKEKASIYFNRYEKALETMRLHEQHKQHVEAGKRIKTFKDFPAIQFKRLLRTR